MGYAISGFFTGSDGFFGLDSPKDQKVFENFLLKEDIAYEVLPYKELPQKLRDDPMMSIVLQVRDLGL